ncbi:MAG: lipopolysaccharide biosynthesis protein [Limnohabitans sp.]
MASYKVMAMEKVWQRNAAALYALQIANYIMPLLTLPFLVRTLGPEAYGWLAFSAAVNFYAVLAMDAGMNTYGARMLAQLNPVHDPCDAQQAGALMANISALKLLCAMACGTVLLVLVQITPAWRSQSALFAWSFLPVLGSLTFPAWFFQGMQVMHLTMILGVVGRLLVTGALFLCVSGPADLLWAAAFQGGSTLMSGLLACLVLMRMPGLRWSWPTWRGVCGVAVNSREFAVSEFSLTAVANSTVFLVGLVQTKEVVGIYAAIEKALRAAASSFMPLIQAMQPRFVQAWSQSPERVPDILWPWSRRVAGLSWVCGLTGIALTPWALQGLFGRAIEGYEGWGQILCIWLPFAVINALLAQWWWVGSGRGGAYARRVLPGVLLQAVLFFTVINGAGVLWGIWCWVLCEMLMTGLLLFRSGWFDDAF